MRILWHSNAPWAGSGYGQQTDLFTRLMIEDGHQVKASAFYGLSGKPLQVAENLEVLPSGHHPHGRDTIKAHWMQYHPDVFVGLYDVWVIEKGDIGGLPLCWWTPVDCDPIPPKVASSLRNIKHPWAMSKFGERKMREVGIEPRYVPHGVDTDVYKPIDRVKAKASLNVPDDAFLFCTVAANKGFPSRKNLSQMLKAFAKLCESFDDIYFYVHTLTLPAYDGLDVERVVEFYNIPDDKIIFPSSYEVTMGMHSPEMLNIIYNAADAFILPSAGEGFGVPAIEAQSAGCPVILSDFTAQSELCGSGMLIPVDRFNDTIIGMHYSEQANLMQPGKILDAMTKAYLEWGDVPEMRTKARDFAMAYDYRTVYEKYMKPALEAAAQWNNVRRPVKGNSADKYALLGNDYHWRGDFAKPDGHYRKWIDYQLSHLPEDGNGLTVLDFGCGDGYPASVLQKRGYQVWGVEPHDGARAIASDKVPFPDGRFYASLNEMAPQRRLHNMRALIDIPDDNPLIFDYVVALDVIEHIEDDADLEQLCAVIRNVKEYALVSTPPPGKDDFAVRGFTVNQINTLFPEMDMHVLEKSKVDQLVKLVARAKDKTLPGILNIAVLSDCRVPTRGDGAHGLGNSAYQIAEGLAKRGHSVTLYAGKGSSFDHGKCVTHDDELARAVELAKKPPAYDVFIDTSHQHHLSQLQPDWNIINRMGDGECQYSPPNMVVMTQFLRKKYGGGRIIKTGIDVSGIPKPLDHLPDDAKPLFFGRLAHGKGVETAMEVARLAGVELDFAGPNQGGYPVESQEVTGDDKWRVIQRASCVIVPGGADHAPRVPLECAAAGVPVLTMPYDGTHEHVEDGVTGFICDDTPSLADKIKDVASLDGQKMREWVENCHSFKVMIEQYEAAANDLILGVRW